jgi:hypothetical protein
MPKTDRVDYLLQHFGELDDGELAEAREIAMGRPHDYTPIIPGTDADPVRDPDYVDELLARNRDGGPKTPRSLEFDIDPAAASQRQAPVQRGERLEGLAALEERLSMLEATARDLYAKIKALEARLGVGKDPA